MITPELKADIDLVNECLLTNVFPNAADALKRIETALDRAATGPRAHIQDIAVKMLGEVPNVNFVEPKTIIGVMIGLITSYYDVRELPK